ncbi:MAG: hypothetical protein WC069_01400 [Candidatus Shapirobacteria bacterium]
MPKAILPEHPIDTGNYIGPLRVIISEVCDGKVSPISQIQYDEYVKAQNPTLAIGCPKCRKVLYVAGVTL